MKIVDFDLEPVIDSEKIESIERRRLVGVEADGVRDPYIIVAREAGDGDYDTILYAGTYGDAITEMAHLIRALYRDYPAYIAKLPERMVGHGRVRERVVGRYVPPAARN